MGEEEQTKVETLSDLPESDLSDILYRIYFDFLARWSRSLYQALNVLNVFIFIAIVEELVSQIVYHYISF